MNPVHEIASINCHMNSSDRLRTYDFSFFCVGSDTWLSGWMYDSTGELLSVIRLPVMKKDVIDILRLVNTEDIANRMNYRIMRKKMEKALPEAADRDRFSMELAWQDGTYLSADWPYEPETEIPGIFKDLLMDYVSGL